MFIRFLFAFFLLTALSAAEDFPYTAAVAEQEIAVRSGPGTEFYPTSTLRLGERIEVFCEENDWCAIRPPLGSFSWISASYVELLSGNIGRVNAEGLASRIGSDPSLFGEEHCDTVQIKLKKNEKVLILGKTETPENAASPLWYKIAPPSGEFRWVPKNALIGKRREEKNNPHITQVVYESETASSTPLTPPAKVIPVPLPQATPSAAAPVLRYTPSATGNQPEFQKAFEALKAETRNVLTRPTEDWVFQILIDRANELFNVAPTDNDMEKVYNILESLQRTRNVRQEIAIRRHFQTGALSPQPASPYSAVASNSGAPRPAAALPSVAVPSTQRTASSSEIARIASNPNVPRSDTFTPLIPKPQGSAGFDLTGKIGMFDPLPKGHPPYAVVNGNGEVICLVTPSDGIDLKPLLGKTVGINGEIGFYEKQGQPNRRHIRVLEVKAL